MRLAELAARGGVSVATVKFYRREGLLAAGEVISTTRAEYGEEHVRRIRLVRALTGVAGLTLDQVRDVLAALDTQPAGRGTAVAHALLSPLPEEAPTEESRARVAALVAKHGWHVPRGSTHATALAAALDAMVDAGIPMSERHLRDCVAAAERVARADFRGVAVDRDATDATTYAVLGTLLVEPVVVALRRMAQQHLSRSGAGAP